MSLDLTFNDEQEMLRDMVRGLCESEADLAVVRAMEDDPIGYPAGLWKQLADLDLLGLLLPEAYGGSAMTLLEGVVVYEEFGRSLAPSPHFVSAVMAGNAIARAGSPDQAAALLPSIISGESIVTIAWIEPGQGFSPRGISTAATPSDSGFTLSGTKWHAAFAQAADKMIVLARTGSEETDIDLFLVDTAAAGVTLRQMTSISSDTQFEVVLDNVAVGLDARLGEAGTGWAIWEDCMLDGAILQAAQAVGGAQFVLGITNQYAKDRIQFDKPLGAFQAISHYLADAKTAIDGAEVLVHEAAWSRSENRDISRLAPMAKYFATKTYRDTTAMAQQVFGGVGFTLEYDVQLYFRRAKALQISWWDKRACEDRIAASVLDAPTLVI